MTTDKTTDKSMTDKEVLDFIENRGIYFYESGSYYDTSYEKFEEETVEQLIELGATQEQIENNF